MMLRASAAPADHTSGSESSFQIGEYVQVVGDKRLQNESGWTAGFVRDGRLGIARKRGGCMYVDATAVRRVSKPPQVDEDVIFRRVSEARNSSSMFLPLG